MSEETKKKKKKEEAEESIKNDFVEENEANESEESTIDKSEKNEEETKESVTSEELENEGQEESSEDSSKDSKYKTQIDELNDRVVRQMAEFENFRKRSEKEKQQMFETGAKSIIEKILPVVDNFERGLSTLSEEEKGNKFAEGMQMIYKQLMDELEKLEVKPIEAVGKEFDPNLHNAVMQTESDEYESGTVAQELLKGYTYRDQVVRHSMVSVVQ